MQYFISGFLANIHRGEDALKASWRRFQCNNFSSSKTFWRRLQDVLEVEKSLRFIMTKNRQFFRAHIVISLDFDYECVKVPMRANKM